MNKAALRKILEHPDKEELISKLIIGISPKDIHEWLKYKYTNVSESKFVISEKSIKTFQDTYLDVYNIIQEDLIKTKSALAVSKEDELQLTVQNSPTYKKFIIKSAEEELDIRQTIKRMVMALENRFAQVFDEIQEDPRNINTRIDRLMIEYAEVLGNLLDKCHKFTEMTTSTQIINNNVTLQVVDQHISVFHDVIKDVLSQMDLETSLYFMEVFNEKMSKLKMPDKESSPSSEMRLAEAKLLNETINKKID